MAGVTTTIYCKTVGSYSASAGGTIQLDFTHAGRFLEDRVGEQFDSLVTGASDKGTWVRLLTVPVEGKVVQGAGGADVGDRVRVQLMSVDVDRGFIDFRRVGRT